MGATATAINLSLDSWQKSKPDGFKGNDLDNALEAFEDYRDKTIQLDAKCLCVSDLKDALSWMEKKLAGLESIAKACKKTAADLRKRDDAEWKSAANFVDGTEGEARRQAVKIR